ncbi:MAG TPA: NADH-quinone oxidoreductase subunit D [Gammaproteobacteria bacterium]|nr:NADH-quinone oxidoreductase subunit D [Gammaproteobacteria bacterium]
MLRSWLKWGEADVEEEAPTLPPQEYRVSQAIEWEGGEMILSMGPQHPSTHGVLRLALVTDGEIVKKVTPHLGYMHRCFEKHAEAVDYPGIIPYTDRVDYLASMNQNITYALTVEKLMGLKVPERVEYIRVIMCEFNRIASHLVSIGTYGLDIGAFTPFLWCFRDREKILDLLEWVSGARMLYNYIWIGGVARDLPEGWLEKAESFLEYFEPRVKELNDLLSYNKIFVERTAAVGILTADKAISYGVTGPNLRASGVKWDLRRNDPYSIYDRFDFDIPVGTDTYGPLGSCWNRYMVRVWEVQQSIHILRQALAALPSGDVQEALPKKIRVPKGEVYARTETPRGEMGFYLISDGSDKPFRLKCRAPSFSNISAIVDMLDSRTMIADIVAIIGSIDIVLCDIDR